jgi:hypothetical protein
MADEKEKGFGGIFSGLKKMIFTEDYIESTQNVNTTIKSNSFGEDPRSSNSAAAINTNTSITSNVVAPKEMVEKIYGLLENINKPGIDFFELWNAAEAMGGINATNIQNAFTTLKVLGLTKETLLSSGNGYVQELQEKINADIKSKQDDKNNMLLLQKNEKTQLQADKGNLEKQIQDLNKALSETNSKLGNIESKFAPQISAIETKIQVGSTALNMVTSEMKTVLETIKSSIN